MMTARPPTIGNRPQKDRFDTESEVVLDRDPAVLDRSLFLIVQGIQGLVENGDQRFQSLADAHGQIVAVFRRCGDLQIGDPQALDGVGRRRQIDDRRVQFAL